MYLLVWRGREAKYDDLPERYTIFICEYDPMRKGLAIYNAEYTVKQTRESLGVGSHIAWLMGSTKGRTL